MTAAPDLWPALPYDAIAPTVDYVHRLAQIAGKYTLDLPFEPNWGEIVFPIGPRGIGSPVLHAGEVVFTVEYGLLDDRVDVVASTGRTSLPLGPGSVADFYGRFVDAVARLGIPAPRTTSQPEIAGAPPLDHDDAGRPYDSAAARIVWAALASAAGALRAWQAPFRGHRPPVGLMWGGFDLAATRYSGHRLSPPPTSPIFQQHGMTEEVVALGFSFGDDKSRSASFYAYVSPPPDGLFSTSLGVDGAFPLPDAGLLVLPWDVARNSSDPNGTVVAFADAVYAAAVELAGWPSDLVDPRHDGWYASSHPLP